MNYIQKVIAEMKHVTWPKQETVWVYTILVVVTSFFVAYYLWGLDLGFQYLLSLTF